MHLRMTTSHRMLWEEPVEMHSNRETLQTWRPRGMGMGLRGPPRKPIRISRFVLASSLENVCNDTSGRKGNTTYICVESVCYNLEKGFGRALRRTLVPKTRSKF